MNEHEHTWESRSSRRAGSVQAEDTVLAQAVCELGAVAKQDLGSAGSSGESPNVNEVTAGGGKLANS
jgi:hypothetical protein